MNDVPPSEESLRQEIEALGQNLIGAVRSIWDAPESKRMRDEMTSGLSDLGSTLKREADYLASHPATQQIKTDVGQIGEKIKAPEAQAAVRRELLSALQTVNSELHKVIDRWSAYEAGGAAPSGANPGEEEPTGDTPTDNPAD